MKAGPCPLAHACRRRGRDGMDREHVVAVDQVDSSPKAAARCASRVRLCWESGVEIAQWLFWQKNRTGAVMTLAQFNASLTSPSLLAPSPK